MVFWFVVKIWRFLTTSATSLAAPGKAVPCHAPPIRAGLTLLKFPLPDPARLSCIRCKEFAASAPCTLCTHAFSRLLRLFLAPIFRGISGPLTLALSLNRKTRKAFTIQPLRAESAAPDPVAEEFKKLLKNTQIPADKRKSAEEYAGNDATKIKHAVKRLSAILDEVTAAQLDAEGMAHE